MTEGEAERAARSLEPIEAAAIVAMAKSSRGEMAPFIAFGLSERGLIDLTTAGFGIPAGASLTPLGLAVAAILKGRDNG